MQKKIVKASLITAALLAPLLLLAPAVSAAVRCETQYGGAQVCVRTGALQLNKQVLSPTERGGDGLYKDYLGLQSGVRFRVGDPVTFQIIVKNTGDAKFDTVTVTDNPFPYFLDLTEGNLNSEIKNLEPGQVQTLTLKGKVKNADLLTKAMDCAVNTAEAKGRDISGQDSSDRDSVEVCYEKELGKAAALPKAGFEDSVIWVFLSIFAGTSGLFLRRFATRKSW